MQEITVRGQKLILLHQKAIYWQEQKTLMVADFHIGKGAHFRRNGIPVHSGIDKVNLKNLYSILKKCGADHLIFLGDLFHNKVNGEWKDLKNFIDNYKSVHVTLVLGNHDLLSREFYGQLNFKVVVDKLWIAPFLFTHVPQEIIDDQHYNLAGHVHPGIVLKGKGKQFERLPCFYFNQKQGILPAFGEFTGLTVLKPKKEDQVYIVTESDVLHV